MSVFIPLTADRLSLRLTPHTVVHASELSPFEAWRDFQGRGATRTVCGSDAFVVVHGVRGRPGEGVAAPWPPLPDDRCADCAVATGVGRRARRTAGHWLGLSS